jgi:glyoxylase-like metal-dependent hydrolase (beta-lactamase superfamily II)
MKIKQLFDHDTCTYTYLLWDESTKNSIIIDPVLEQLDRDINLINKLKLKLIYIFETHVHADHITAASKLKEFSNAKICYGSKTGVDGADILFNDGDKINLGKYEIIAIYTPGHTSGCVSYYIQGSIFTGDTLFIEGTGRTDFQEGSSSEIYDSVKNKIFSYPDDTIVYPCHNYNGFLNSTIGHERNFNPNVGDKISKEIFIDNESKKNRPYPKRFDIAVPANLKCGKI